jgi:hypothetical protein
LISQKVEEVEGRFFRGTKDMLAGITKFFGECSNNKKQNISNIKSINMGRNK